MPHFTHFIHRSATCTLPDAYGTLAFPFQEQRPFEICYAHGKGLVSSAEFA